MTREEMENMQDEIDILLGNGDYAEAHAKIAELEEQWPNSTHFYKGLAYYCGWGVEEDKSKALNHLLKSAQNHDRLEGTSYFFCGMLYENCFSDYDKAVKYYALGDELGDHRGKESIANCLYLLALDARELAVKTISPSEYSQANAVAVENASVALTYYYEAIDIDPEELSLEGWCGLGRTAIFLYTLACRGEIDTNIQTKDKLSSYFFSGAGMFAAQMNTDIHLEWWQHVVYACDLMDKHGYPLIAEHFRAFGGLIDAKFHKSAEAFYRVRWHMKRIGELKKDCDEDICNTVCNYLKDINDEFEKMNRKYAGATREMMRSGKLPDLSPSYFEDNVPDVDSCENFMNMFHYEGSSSYNHNIGGKKGLFGLFKK